VKPHGRTHAKDHDTVDGDRDGEQVGGSERVKVLKQADEVATKVGRWA